MGDKGQTQDGRHAPLRALATRQHGVVSTRQLGALGYTRSSAAKAEKAGRLRRVHRGAYAVGHEQLTWEGRCMAAVLAARPAVVSHLSAGWIWGLLRTRPGSIHVTTPTSRRAQRPFVVHAATLAEVDIAFPRAIPATSPARTYLDLAAGLSAQQLERILERGEELQIFDLAAFDDVLARAGGHPGAGRLRRALEIYRPEPAFTRSGLEKRFLAEVRKAGLPAPAMNFNVGGFELDAYWAAEGFAVELEVFETHGTRAAFERDRIRQDDLMLIGVEMIRVTGPRMKREPKATIERVSSHLQRRRRERAGRQVA